MTLAALVVVGCAIGGLGGWLYFRALRRSIERALEGDSYLLRALVLRLSVAFALLAFIAWLSPVLVVSAVPGFLLARRLALRRMEAAWS